MIHPHTELRHLSDEVGYGVVATAFIPKGTITWALDALDREFAPAEVAGMELPYREILEKYCYRNNRGNYVLCWDHGRFVNHSFRSNCVSTAYNFEVAVRDIYPGEELTDDYGYLNVTEPFQPIDEDHLRKWVYPDDLLHFHEEWDQQAREALQFVDAVEQPLRWLLAAATWRTLKGIAKGRRRMASIRTLHFAADGQMGAQAAT